MTTRVLKLEDSELISELFDLSKKKPKLVKNTESAVPGHEEISVHSWKMNEFKYYDVPSPFPTLARGLFTTKVDETPDAVVEPGAKHRIVIRGYDKFFNIGEVPWNTWESLASHTSAPYTLSLKSNGCIIFIAALTKDKLIVTSKHSVGTIAEPKPNAKRDEAPTLPHAQVGRQWLQRYLIAKGKTEADLAGVLWDRAITAVAELCDDSFEEHVLPYPPHLTGLHLHGLNINSRHFQTLPTAEVDAFAEEWGFIRTPTLVLNSVAEVKAFTDEVGATGKWNGEAVEGFVVRSTVNVIPTSGPSFRDGSYPYETGSSYFFKVKFDEPYMMYRDWRELTKSLLTINQKFGPREMKPEKLPKGKMRREETKKFVNWVIYDIKTHPELYVEYGKNRGICASRERYFRWVESGKGLGWVDSGSGSGSAAADGTPAATESSSSSSSNNNNDSRKRKTVIVPVAIPGCGKTTVSLALARLFGWGHTQSDDVQAKKAGPQFVKNVVNLLAGPDFQMEKIRREKERKGRERAEREGKKGKGPKQQGKEVEVEAEAAQEETVEVPEKRGGFDVVIADKNNHLRLHRTMLREALESAPQLRDEKLPVRLVALHWSLEKQPPAMIHRVCSERILGRGEAHQTLVPVQGRVAHHEEVVWMFINNTEDLSPSEVDDIVDMEIDPKETAEDQVRRAVDGLVPLLHLERPSDERIREVVEEVREYERALGEAKANAAKRNAAEGAGGKQGGGKKGASAAEGKTKKSREGAVGGAAPRYFAILPEFDVKTFLDERIAALSTAITTTPATKNAKDQAKLDHLTAVWTKLKKDSRVTRRPHVTIAHRNGLKELGRGEDAGREVRGEEAGRKVRGEEAGKVVWARCASVAGGEAPPVFEGVVRRVVWSEKVVALTFEDVRVVAGGGGADKAEGEHKGTQQEEEEEEEELVRNTNRLNLEDGGQHGDSEVAGSSSRNSSSSKTALRTASELIASLPNEVMRRLHVTVGTRDGGIAPVEGKWAVEQWRAANEGCVGEQEGKEEEGEEEGEKEGEKEDVWAFEIGEVRVSGLLKGMSG